MPGTRIEAVDTDERWDAAVGVLRQLWTDADREFLLSWREDPDYHLFGRYREDELVGVVGVSVQRVLHHARHAWIHDLVVDADHRSEGHGRALTAFAREWARRHDCEYVALAVREGNDRAAEFYEADGMDRWGHVYEEEL